MKNKKGFTLIELIAVLAVLGILLMMTVPNIINLFDNKKEDLYNKTILELERISRQYLLDNPNLYSTIEKDGYVDVNIDDLCTADIIECPISDPRDNSEIKGYIRVIYSDNDYDYEFVRS